MCLTVTFNHLSSLWSTYSDWKWSHETLNGTFFSHSLNFSFSHFHCQPRLILTLISKLVYKNAIIIWPRVAYDQHHLHHHNRTSLFLCLSIWLLPYRYIRNIVRCHNFLERSIYFWVIYFFSLQSKFF